MKKTILIPAKPQMHSPLADAWVKTPRTLEDFHEPAASAPASFPAPSPLPAEPMKRFTIDVTEELHKRIKAQCAMRGTKMANVIRDLLEREFPKSA